MESLQTYIDLLPQYAGIAVLMLSTFLIGYFYAWYAAKASNRRLIERLKKQVNNLKLTKKAKDIDTIFTEIKPKIVEVVKQTQEAIVEENEVTETLPEKNRTTFIDYTETKEKKSVPASEVDELDFDSFGYADATDKDDLTLITGVGPYIERRLNEIGIYNFDQISKLSHRDIEIVTDLIDFFPGRIERDNWVGQAEGLKVL